MTPPLLFELLQLRRDFLKRLKGEVLFRRDFTDKLKHIVGSVMLPAEQQGTVNVADVANYISSRIGWEWAARLPGEFHSRQFKGQTAGDRFTSEIRRFLQQGVSLCRDLHATKRTYLFEQANRSTAGRSSKKGVKARNPRIKASMFAQYQHLSLIQETFKQRPDLEAVFGSDYIVEPDIVVFSEPLDASALGGRPSDPVATYTPLISGAEIGRGAPLLQASVSCKLTIRSDRAQNARLEALNLIRTRKGRVPTIAFVTAEPLPSRISSLALGTGDVDCIYHAALYELVDAVEATIRFSLDRLPDDNASDTPLAASIRPDEGTDEEPDAGAIEAVPTKGGLATQRAKLKSMIDQGRLRDISDLVLDLLI